MEIDLEFVLEGIGVGLDALILGLLYKSYESCTAYIEALKVYTILYSCSILQLRTWFNPLYTNIHLALISVDYFLF